MPPWEFWVWALAILACMAGLAILLLALLHVRYRAAWQGEWTGDLPFPYEGSLRVEFGFPGFMRAWTWKPSPPAPEVGEKTTVRGPHFSTARKEFEETHRADLASSPQEPSAPFAPFVRPESHERADATSAAGSKPTVPNPGAAEAESRPGKKRKREKDPHRARKSLFRFLTDRSAWALVIRYGFRVTKLVHRLFRPRINVAMGHPDPALLGRLAGKWYAAAPLLPVGHTAVNFRFQDRHPSLRLNVEGGFSALSLLFFGIAVFGVFPFFGLGRRAWRGWWQPQLTGWRAWAYRHIQSL